MKLPFEINCRGKLAEKDTLQGVIAKFIASSGGRSALAASMINPIRRNLDYQGIARRAFPVDQLPQGALPYYSKDDE